MKREKKIWLGWAGFGAMVAGFIALEEYAVRTKQIAPFSELMWKVQAVPKHPTKREAMKFLTMGAWLGFCVWGTKHFFWDNPNK